MIGVVSTVLVLPMPQKGVRKQSASDPTHSETRKWFIDAVDGVSLPSESRDVVDVASTFQYQPSLRAWRPLENAPVNEAGPPARCFR